MNPVSVAFMFASDHVRGISTRGVVVRVSKQGYIRVLREGITKVETWNKDYWRKVKDEHSNT